MFSALKLAAAAVIVALFGGFLLTGILTTPQGDDMTPGAVTESPSPMTSEELLSGMVTEEVEPGVYRVVNDGVRDLAYSEHGFRVDVTPDGSVWLSGPGDGQDLFLLGEERVFEGRMGGPHFRKVAPDGSLWSADDHWAIDGRDIFSFDGERWTVRATTTDRLSMLAVGPDGTVWVAVDDPDKHCPDIEADACYGTVLLRLEDDGSLTTIEDWADVHDGDVGPRSRSLAVSPDGDVWLVAGGRTVHPTRSSVGGEGPVLLRFDGEGWEAIPGPEGWALGSSLVIGPDGTLWVDASRDVGEWNRDALARYDDAGWTTFTEADGVDPWDDIPMAWPPLPKVAADGSLWLQSSYFRGCGSGDDLECGERCGGAAHYDGTTWTSYLVEYCISDLAIAPDGSVWLGAEYWGSGWSVAQAYDDDDTDIPGLSSLYVITPEAVAGTE